MAKTMKKSGTTVKNPAELADLDELRKIRRYAYLEACAAASPVYSPLRAAAAAREMAATLRESAARLEDRAKRMDQAVVDLEEEAEGWRGMFLPSFRRFEAADARVVRAHGSSVMDEDHAREPMPDCDASFYAMNPNGLMFLAEDLNTDGDDDWSRSRKSLRDDDLKRLTTDQAEEKQRKSDEQKAYYASLGVGASN
jgi:hypothetical protein